jgi:hypothetical protein
MRNLTPIVLNLFTYLIKLLSPLPALFPHTCPFLLSWAPVPCNSTSTFRCRLTCVYSSTASRLLLCPEAQLLCWLRLLVPDVCSHSPHATRLWPPTLHAYLLQGCLLHPSGVTPVYSLYEIFSHLVWTLSPHRRWPLNMDILNLLRFWHPCWTTPRGTVITFWHSILGCLPVLQCGCPASPHLDCHTGPVIGQWMSSCPASVLNSPAKLPFTWTPLTHLRGASDPEWGSPVRSSPPNWDLASHWVTVTRCPAGTVIYLVLHKLMIIIKLYC